MERTFPIIINRIIDGDSLDIDIVLGFGIVLQNRRLRLMGVDTPEVRTSDLEEKKYGLLAKSFVEKWCMDKTILLVIRENQDEQDKFGRILGDLLDIDGSSLVNDIIANYHGVAYEGQNKDDIKYQHLKNRIKIHL
jgi:micrococcal nuclease